MREKAVPDPEQLGSSSTPCTRAYSGASGSQARKSACRASMMVPPASAALRRSRSQRRPSFCGVRAGGSEGAETRAQSGRA